MTQASSASIAVGPVSSEAVRRISGLHHVTAICGDPQTNIDFYAGALGMRLVKLTVNFDDPGSYHFYYGDSKGTPGSNLTFFPHPGGYRGALGPGQATSIGLSIPLGSLTFWKKRLSSQAIDFKEEERLGDRLVSLLDPDGIQLELVESAANGECWADGPVPVEHAIRGVHAVSLIHRDSASTLKTLVDEMGFELDLEAENWTRYAGTTEGIGRYVDLIEDAALGTGRVAVGSVHHVAFRTEDLASQLRWREQLMASGHGVSPVTQRDYFQSIYFREKGGVLFEIATDGPGMTIDEPLESLGTVLRLPAQYEPYRVQIEKTLVPIRLPLIRE